MCTLDQQPLSAPQHIALPPARANVRLFVEQAALIGVWKKLDGFCNMATDPASILSSAMNSGAMDDPSKYLCREHGSLGKLSP